MLPSDITVVDYNNRILTEEDVRARVKELYILVLADRKLKHFRTDDEYLLRYLHCTNFNVQEAFKRLQDFYDLLQEYPDWFASTSPLDKRTQIDKNVKVMLRDRDKFGRRIFLVKLGKIDTSTTYPQEQVQLDEIWLESVMNEPKTQATGISIILDMKEYSWRMFRWLTPTNMKVSSVKADLYPCKEIVYHVVNTSFLVTASIKLAWPFLTDKIKNMIKFHFENWPSLHEYIDPEILPPEYGGKGPKVDYEKLNQLLYDQDIEIGDRLSKQKVVEKSK